jgi:hypothetical protein
VRATGWVGTEVREHPVYNGTLDLDSFMHNMEENIREDQRISVLDVDFQNTPTEWWSNHKSVLITWDELNHAINYRF